MVGMKEDRARSSSRVALMMLCAACLAVAVPSFAWADTVKAEGAETEIAASGQEADVEVPEGESALEPTGGLEGVDTSRDSAPVPTETDGDGQDPSDGTASGDDEPEVPAPAPVVGFVREGDTVRYYYEDGSPAKEAWVTHGGRRYYFNANGVAVRWGQWIDDASGRAFYYFNKDCQMVTGWVTWNADGLKSYFGNDGKALSGWQNIGGSRYYFSPASGKSLRWSQVIDGANYYFNANSQMVKGLVTFNADGLKSYFGTDGKRRTGWQEVGGKWYYFSPNTGKSVRWSQYINGNWFYFNKNSQMHTGLLTWSKDGTKSYFDPKTGRRQTGWVQTGGKWYYFSPSSGKSLRWSQYINGNWFYFNANYQMHTGLLTWSKDGSKSYFDPKTGRRQTGWKETSNGVWYYFSPSTGKSVRWHQRIGGNWFYFNANYQMHRGWLKWNGVQKWSYFNQNGRQVFGTQTIDGYRYTFDKDGETTTKPIIMPADQMAMFKKAQNYYSNTGCLILVNSRTHKVGVFWGSSYNWKLDKYWDCTTGALGSPTVKGTYTVQNRGKSFGSGYTCWYWTQFYGNYLFHSVLYQPGSMTRIQDGRLGISASHGCVRLSLENARWIYNNVPRGTRVVSY